MCHLRHEDAEAARGVFSGRIRQKAGAIVQICHHREIPHHVDVGENRLVIVAMLHITNERHPGIVMTPGAFFDSAGARSISSVLDDKDRSLFPGELKRDIEAGLQGSGGDDGRCCRGAVVYEPYEVQSRVGQPWFS